MSRLDSAGDARDPATDSRPAPPPLSLPAPDAAGAAALGPSEKAAIVIVALGPEVSSDLLREMGEGAVRRFAQAVSRMRQIPRDTVEQVLSEFLVVLGDDLTLRGGSDAARRFLGKVMDGEALSRVFENLDGQNGRSLWARLADAADAPFAIWLQTEHPQLVSVVLSRLRSDQAARLLERLDAPFAQEVVLRMSRPTAADAQAIGLAAGVIEKDFLSAAAGMQGGRKPSEMIAGLMNHVSGASREEFLRHMDSADPKLAQDVQRVMFTFGDISSRVTGRDIAAVVKTVDESLLLTALKSARMAQDPTAEFIFGNISKRLSERLAEDIDAMSEPTRKEGEAAQAEVVQAIQALVKTGDIKLIEPEGDDD